MKKSGSTPLLYQAVRTAKLKAQRMAQLLMWMQSPKTARPAECSICQMVRCASSGCSNRSMPVD